MNINKLIVLIVYGLLKLALNVLEHWDELKPRGQYKALWDMSKDHQRRRDEHRRRKR